MSDVLALPFNDAVGGHDEDDVIGEYSSFDPDGIRSERYGSYGRTYGAFSGSGVHFDGEIYAGIGWRLRTNFGLDQGTLLDYIVDGMNYTPAGPAFEDMRDGILEAVKAAGSPADHECRVWRAFAAGGVGVGADAVVRRKSVTVNESMLLPAQCQ